MKRFILITGIAISLCVFSACEKEENNITEPQEQSNLSPEKKAEMISVLQKAGFDTNNIVVEKDRFVVEGDILIDFASISELDMASKVQKKESNTKAYTFYHPQFVSHNNIKDVKIYVDPSIKAIKWSKSVTDAVAEWNKLSDKSAINMRIVNLKKDADIVVKTYTEQPNFRGMTVGRGYLPLNGKVGHTIEINTELKGRYAFSESKKLLAMAHELGHTIGFAHSEYSWWERQKLISGTSRWGGPKSVMYPQAHDWFGFTADEKKAAELLYPKVVAPVKNEGEKENDRYWWWMFF